MEQQNAGSSPMRNRENQGGFGKDRQGQTNKRAFKGGEKAGASNPRLTPKPLEKKAKWSNGEKVISWEMRCAELGYSSWVRYAGPPEAWKAVRGWADALDHDEARPIGWGKTVVIEACQIGGTKILRFGVSGQILYRYTVKALD